MKNKKKLTFVHKCKTVLLLSIIKRAGVPALILLYVPERRIERITNYPAGLDFLASCLPVCCLTPKYSVANGNNSSSS